MATFRYLIPALIFMFAGCADDSSDRVSELSKAQKMVVSFTWPKDYGKCFDPKNPEINVSNFPENTAYFKVKVIDIQNNDYDHGGGTVTNDGTGKIPYGSLSHYDGPCPSQAPTGSGTYEFTVFAYNTNDSLVGRGSSLKEYP